jgi:cytochrome c556
MRLALPVLVVCLAACAPKEQIPVEQIPQLANLDAVMKAQARAADPQFKKIGVANYTDADWAAFSDAAQRLQATANRTKQFSKGAEFDALADQVREQAIRLGEAAQAKDAAAASGALSEMKTACKTCHKKFR